VGFRNAAVLQKTHSLFLRARACGEDGGPQWTSSIAHFQRTRLRDIARGLSLRLRVVQLSLSLAVLRAFMTAVIYACSSVMYPKWHADKK